MKHILTFSFIIFAFFAQSQRTGPESNDELLASQLMSSGEYEKAVVLYEELFEKNPSPIIYNNYLRCLIELEEFRKAERLVDSQIKDNPGRARFAVDLGFVFTRSGDTRKARRQLEGLINNVNMHPIAITDLANAFLHRDFVDYALQTYLKGKQALGMTHPFNIQIADIYGRKGDYPGMMNEYIDLVVEDNSYLEQVQGILQDAINNDPEFLKSDALRRILLQGSQRNPSQTMYAELLLWLSIQQNDFDMAFRQARALDRRMQLDGKLVLDVARLSTSNNQYNIARQSYEYIIGLGDLSANYLEATIGLLNVKYLQATSGYEIDYELLKEVESEYKKNIDQLGLRAQTVSMVRNLAQLKAFYLNNTEEASELLRTIIELPNVSSRIKGECRIELADILLLKGELWDAHLIYALVDRTFRDDPLAHEARFKNARLSFYMGEFKWSQAQLDVLKAATSRLIANDAMALSLLIQDNLEQDGTSVPLKMFARAQMHSFMHNYELALVALDSIHTRFAVHQIIDNVLMEKARIYVKTGQYDVADSILADITRLYPQGLHASDALFQRGLLQERKFNNTQLAMDIYQDLMIDYPGSLNTVNARNRFRYLRGDGPSDDYFINYNFTP